MNLSIFIEQHILYMSLLCRIFLDKHFKSNEALGNSSIRLTRYQEAIVRFKQIDPMDLKTVFSSDNSIITINTCIASIDEYTAYIESHVLGHESGTTIPIKKTGGATETIVLREFFVSTNGYYLDPVESIARFIEASCKLLYLYEDSISQQNKTFLISNNIFTSEYMVSNLCTIAGELINGLKGPTRKIR